MIKYKPIATKQLPDPYDERDGVWFSADDLKKLQQLPAGTMLYVKVTVKTERLATERERADKAEQNYRLMIKNHVPRNIFDWNTRK